MVGMEYYLATKTCTIPTQATTWTTLENVLSERSPSVKTTYCLIPRTRNAHNRQVQTDRKWTSGCLGLGVGGMGIDY